jgi:hypothetical protein
MVAMGPSQDDRMNEDVGAPQPAEPATNAPGEVIDLGAVDRGTLWSRLMLTQTQLAELAGLSQRQVSRWVAHGLLIPSSRSPDRFNGDAVEKAILMQRAIKRGHRPTQASRIATLALARQMQSEHHFRVPLEPDVREKLLAAQTAIATALEILFPGGAAPRAQSLPAQTPADVDAPVGAEGPEGPPPEDAANGEGEQQGE